MLEAIEYMFSDDDNWVNQTLYCVKLCKGTYVQQMLVSTPWIRKTTPKKCASYWMAKNVAEHVCEEAKSVGYFESKVEKVHWWNVVARHIYASKHLAEK